MKLQGAVIREQGQTFAVVIVKRHLLDDTSKAADAVHDLSPTFGGIPVVLMAQDGNGRPTFYGRPDIAQFLSKVPLRAIPWREYTIN
jgi:hypothetical protein